MNQATVTAQPGQSTIRISRIFDAPRDKVFTAMTTKELVAKWWVGRDYKVTVKELDARSGGTWHYIQASDAGDEFSFHGCFHLVLNDDKHSLVVQTMEFDGLPEPGHVALEKMELTDLPGGKTQMVVISAFSSVEDRDGMIQSGMEEGMNQTYAKLDAVLQDL